MKLPLVVLGLGAVVMVVLAAQALRQELNLRSLRNHVSQSMLDSRKKERDISNMKRKAIEQKSLLEAAQRKLDGLKAQKAELAKSKTDSETNLKSCAEEKARIRYAIVPWAVFVIDDIVFSQCYFNDNYAKNDQTPL